MALVATAAFCVAPLAFTASSADAAPYPPTQPCSVTATERDSGTYDVVGSGLGSIQPVRVVLARTGQLVGSAETDTTGAFRTVVTAPADPDASAPDITASSPRQSCTTPPTPPTPPTTSSAPSPSVSNGPTAPTVGSGGSGRTGRDDSGQDGSDQTGGGRGGVGGSGGGTSTGSAGTSGGAATRTPSSPGTAGDTATSAAPSSGAPGSSGPSTPAVAEPPPGTDTPFGIGLGIAAVLLVLGTLAVLLLTRRSER